MIFVKTLFTLSQNYLHTGESHSQLYATILNAIYAANADSANYRETLPRSSILPVLASKRRHVFSWQFFEVLNSKGRDPTGRCQFGSLGGLDLDVAHHDRVRVEAETLPAGQRRFTNTNIVPGLQ